MKLLMIDTASAVAGAAIISEEKLFGEIFLNDSQKHSRKLLMTVDGLLNSCDQTMSDIDVFGFVKGPGSFTGIRIGAATVKGFAQALKKPIVGVSSLASLAANLPGCGGLICPILDARRGRVYTAAYHWDSMRRLVTDVPEGDLPIETLCEKLSSLGASSVTLVGDGAGLFEAQIQKIIPSAKKAPAHLCLNRAASAAWIGMQMIESGETTDCYEAEPVYLRPSYAEKPHGAQ